MERIELRAQTRTVRGKQVKQLRAAGWVPAVLFGADIPSQPIQIEERVLNRALNRASATSLINLFVDDADKPHVVLIREVQRDVLSNRLLHVDFYRVRLDHKVKTTLPLEIVGETPLVKTSGAVLNHALTHVEIECLPGDLIDSIPVDISTLKDLDDFITVGDLSVPEGITILTDPESVVVSLMVPRAIAAALAATETAEGKEEESPPEEEG